ncbi:hypothetical protein GJ496_009456 [Pomphorhynchus laevis]|nr:hypothetical protein GJ496_009456 [Pomphorhynchus laevis]
MATAGNLITQMPHPQTNHELDDHIHLNGSDHSSISPPPFVEQSKSSSDNLVNDSGGGGIGDSTEITSTNLSHKFPHTSPRSTSVDNRQIDHQYSFNTNDYISSNVSSLNPYQQQITDDITNLSSLSNCWPSQRQQNWFDKSDDCGINDLRRYSDNCNESGCNGNSRQQLSTTIPVEDIPRLMNPTNPSSLPSPFVNFPTTTAPQLSVQDAMMVLMLKQQQQQAQQLARLDHFNGYSSIPMNNDLMSYALSSQRVDSYPPPTALSTSQPRNSFSAYDFSGMSASLADILESSSPLIDFPNPAPQQQRAPMQHFSSNSSRHNNLSRVSGSLPCVPTPNSSQHIPMYRSMSTFCGQASPEYLHDTLNKSLINNFSSLADTQHPLPHSEAINLLTKHNELSRIYGEERYSRKVFVGGLPPDIDEEEIIHHFRRFGPLLVDWPHKAESKSYFPPKGYAFLIYSNERSVQELIEACVLEDQKLYMCVSSPSMKDKPVQIRPWLLSDSDYVMDGSQPLDPRKTIFVGGVPRPLRAVELALIMNRLYGGVCYAGIDTDPELKYPKGAGRVAFSNQQSYIAAISARFVQLRHIDIDKRVEVKPYVLDDQMCDECQGTRCNGKFAPFFCSNVACLQYYCEHCWSVIHCRPGREYHKPLVKEGADRPRSMPFRWS